MPKDQIGKRCYIVMSCSLLIVSNKDKIITLDDPIIEKYASEILVDDTPGISIARNKLGYKAKNDVLLFLDDDIKLEGFLWNNIAHPRPHEVYMAQGREHPITRVMAIGRKAFDDIGGFDENIRHNGEDLDFYWRALDKGYTVGIIPQRWIYHEEHPKANFAKCHFESAYSRVKHGRASPAFFMQKNPLIAILRLAGYVYYSLKESVK